jgi:hypothetical protein
MFTSLEVITVKKKDSKESTTLVLAGGESGKLTIWSVDVKKLQNSINMTLLEENSNSIISIQ